MGSCWQPIKHRRPSSGVFRSVGGTHSCSSPLHLLDVVCVCEVVRMTEIAEIKRRIEVLEVKVGFIIDALNNQLSNLEYGYEWSDQIGEELKRRKLL